MAFVDNVLDVFGRFIARKLQKPAAGHEPFAPVDLDALRRTLRPADVLLVDGGQKISTAIKYLTQSSWSHAALYTGDLPGLAAGDGESCCLIEANVGEGVVAAPLSKYAGYSTRICRPVGLTPDEVRKVVDFALERISHQYDMRNIIDLARYLFPTPPVPTRWRRRMIALGSGEPTRAICSTLIAQAFQSVRYPVLPRIERAPDDPAGPDARRNREIMHIRHHSLFTPRDFDLSPYFQVIKPMIELGFDPHALRWADAGDAMEPDLEEGGRVKEAAP